MIPISRPSIRRKDMDAVLTCLVTDSLGPGSAAESLAKEVAAYLKLAGGVALRERTRALDLAVRRLGLEPGAKVLLDPLVPHSYHATLLAAGFIPEYVDVSPSGPVIDAAAVEAKAEQAAAVITSTHLGFVPELERIAATGLTVIEDISQGIGAHTGNQSVGAFGRFVLLALEPAGIITAGGGTLLLTSIKKERAALSRETEALAPEALLPDMNAALGVTQIKEIEKFVTRRAEIAAVYQRALARGKHRAPTQSGDAESVFY
ncbi:MAG: DegT/DnrJ/EryC1/StrS family aminotransferase, partial [Spirochaetales bacterium]